MTEEENLRPAVPNPFALLVEPEIPMAAARRLASSALPRNTERMDGKKGKVLDPELAKFDEAVELGKFGR